MPKHKPNGYPRKLTLGKMGNRFRINFSKDDAEKIFEAAAQGKELVYKITSDPSTLKEKSVILLLEPLVTDQESRDIRLSEVDQIWKSGDPKKILALLRPLDDADITDEEHDKLLNEVYVKLFSRLKTTGDD